MMSSGMETLSISIHASAKEATVVREKEQRGETISIHASAKEATRDNC